ncbi:MULTISPECIES: CinA family protein [Acidithiobacillus]|jgi:nicotinamide-nucleotide amidase|uniref:CinA-like protein n=1 Tax=Acidithiobacillus thiooxidans ATCC 19377 TaxID=637390 RepID=A0A543Q7Z6_ACITH|nr:MULTISPECIES: CinA family protein [Acidithiobacillus]MDX5936042.1 CinA family protein [Acidithiobacillus thiooxidans]TQN52452.1 CinA-like protein [Acidithiobacillus thiooxidans ATCC 19377]
MNSGELLHIFLPMRPAVLPDAQRLEAWALRSGVRARIELTAVLPDIEGAALGIGAFANAAAWKVIPQRALVPAGDWQGLRDWAEHYLPPCPQSFSHFSDQSQGTEILPGEFWLQEKTSNAFDLSMAPPEWALLQHCSKAGGPRLALAESCTGGGLAARITALSGSSALLQHGIVTYSNTAKRHFLGVQAKTLMRYGAVSEETALEMLNGLLREADLGVAITGIAGPGGAVPGKPVGTVCIAWGQRNGQQQVRTCHFRGDRWNVQYASGSVALGGLLGLLCG